MRDTMTMLSEQEYLAVTTEENCRAILDERMQAVSPSYLSYNTTAQEFLRAGAFPPWRTNREAAECIFVCEVPRSEAFPISYHQLAKKPHLFGKLPFDPMRDYLLTNRIISFHCQICGVRVVKDGNHRLLQCAFQESNPELLIFEVRSNDWSASTIDMKNFCNCIYNNALQATCKNARA